MHKCRQIPGYPPDLPSAGDEQGISRLVSSVGTPEAVGKNSEQVQHDETSQKDEYDNWDSATVDGDELDVVIEVVMNTHKDEGLTFTDLEALVDYVDINLVE